MFGSNPGGLRMHIFAPAHLRPRRPLEVVLHGCRQDVGAFAWNAGWLAIAERHAVDLWVLDGMGHGFPVDPAARGCVHAGPWVIDAGLSAAEHMAQFWGLTRHHT